MREPKIAGRERKRWFYVQSKIILIYVLSVPPPLSLPSSLWEPSLVVSLYYDCINETQSESFLC